MYVARQNNHIPVLFSCTSTFYKVVAKQTNFQCALFSLGSIVISTHRLFVSQIFELAPKNEFSETEVIKIIETMYIYLYAYSSCCLH